MPTHAEILEIVDRLGPLETSLETSAALWVDHKADDPGVAFIAAEKLKMFFVFSDARRLLERLAAVAQLVASTPEDEPVSREALRAVLDGHAPRVTR